MSNRRMILVAALLLLVGGALACVGGPQKPSVEILSPPSGSEVALGEAVQVEYRASDPSAVLRVDLEVAGQVVDSQTSPVTEGQPTMTGVLSWIAGEEGSHTLIVYAYNSDRVASDPVGVSVTVGDGQAVPGSTVTISLLMPGGTATPESTGSPPPPGATATTKQPASSPAPSSTRPPAPTATTPPPTPTQRLAAPPPTATQGQVPARIELINNSGEDIFFVHFGSPFHNLADDQLGSDIIPAGSNYNWNVLAGTYRLQAVADDGFVLDDRSGVDVHGHYQWTIGVKRQPAPPQQVPARIELINNSGEEIYFVHFESPYHAFADDQLGADIIQPGRNYNWNVLAGTYHLQAVASDGYALDEVWGADVHGHYQWVVPQTRQPAMSRFIVFSSCTENIVYLYISAKQGENLVQQGAMFPGESRIFEIPPGQWSFVARDQWDQMLDGGEALFESGSDVYFSVCE
jgi:hypothetical protein